MIVDKIKIEERAYGFEKVTGGSSWNAFARYSDILQAQDNIVIDQYIYDLSSIYLFGLSGVYEQSSYIDFGFLVTNNALKTVILGDETSIGTISAMDKLTISKTKDSANNVYINFFVNDIQIYSYNLGLNWYNLILQIAIYSQNTPVASLDYTIIPYVPLPPDPVFTEYTWFRDNAFKTFFPIHWKRNDSYKDNEGKGFMERFIYVLSKDLDLNVIPLIKYFVEKVRNIETAESQNIALLESEFGVDVIFNSEIEERCRVLRNFFELTKTKGSKRGYEIGMKMVRFGNLKIQDVDLAPDYSSYSDCSSCIPYNLIINGNELVVSLDIIQFMYRVASYNEPISWKLDSIIYNGTSIIGTGIALFFYLNDNDPNLYMDNSLAPTLAASVNNSGDLELTGENESYYEFDKIYLNNKGSLMFRKPPLNAILPFSTNTIDNITKSQFRISWIQSTGADYYLVNIGKSLGDYNGIITDKVVSDYQTNLLEYTAYDLEANTPYFVQIIAIHGSVKVISEIQRCITLQNVEEPIALTPLSIASNHVLLNWNESSNNSGYIIEVATDISFLNIVKTVNNPFKIDKKIIGTLSPNTYFYRLKAYVDKNENGFQIPYSESNYSNIISFDIV